MVDRSCINNQLVESETQIIQTGNNKYDLKYYSYLGNWQLATTLEFIPTQPPGCDYADICTTGFTTVMPDTLTVKQDFSFTTEDECLSYSNLLGEPVIPLAAFSGVKKAKKSSNIFNLTPKEDIEVCYDLQTLKWKFKLLVENTTLNYVKDICLDNIQNPPISATPIYNLSGICNLSSTECIKLKKSLKAHKTYPFTSDLYGGYVFTEILLTHETEHQKDWKGYIRKYVNHYYNIPEKVIYRCQDFTNKQQAKQKILDHIQDLFAADFWNPYKSDWMINEYLWPKDLATAKKKRETEENLHNRESIKLIIQKYENKINKLCESNYPKILRRK